MKRIFLTLTSIILTAICYAQNIGVSALVVDEKIPEEAARQLETKLQNALISNGFVNNSYIERYVLTAKVDITQKDITTTTPARISEKMDITLMVGDVIENKLYSSITLSAAGIGTNENKAFINAFRNIKGDNPKIQEMLNDAKNKILDYYTNHCSEIIQKSKTLTSTQAFDEALFLLSAVPNICEDCFALCQQQAVVVYQQKIDSEATNLLEKAKTAWTLNQNVQGANEVANIICQINPKSSNYNKVISLRNTVNKKLQADEKREWDFKMKQYEDSQAFKRSLVDAAKAIGVAWGQNQPKTVYKTVIRYWW